MILFIKEATNTPNDFFNTKNPKIIPALLTFNEYYDVVNSEDKFHGDDAYNYSLGKLGYYKGDGKLVKNFKIDNIQLQLIEKISSNDYGKWEGEKYVGNMSEDEIREAGLEKYAHNYIVVHPENDNMIVGMAYDEWGAVLVAVIDKYKRLGIGAELVRVYRSKYPDKSSGGFTSAGYQQIKRYYTWMVNRFLSSGIYSDLVRQGKITMKKVKEILESRPIKTKTSKDNTPNPLSKYYREGEKFFYIMNNSVIIFDENLKNIKEIDDNGLQDMIHKKIINGFMHIVDINGYAQIYNLFGSEKYINQCVQIMADQERLNGGIGDYFLRNFDAKYQTIINNIFNNSNDYDVKVLKDEGYIRSVPLRLIIPKKTHTSQINSLKAQTKKWFKQNDQYNELEDYMMEMAESLAE